MSDNVIEMPTQPPKVLTEPDSDLREKLKELGLTDAKFIHEWREKIPRPGYVVYPWIPKGVGVAVVAREKIGKSKLIYSMLAAIERGMPFAGYPCEQAKVLMFQEEPATIIKKHADELDLGAEVRFLVTRMGDMPTIQKAIRMATKWDYKVFCIDTGARFLNLLDENNAAEVVRAVKPLEDMCSELGITIIVILHATKKPKARGMNATRGSTALNASFSHILTVEQVGESTQRRVWVYGRLENSMKLVLDHDVDMHSYSVATDHSNDFKLPPEPVKPGTPKLIKVADALSFFGSQAVARSVVVDRMMKECGVSESTAKRRIGELAVRGEIIEVSPGKWARR